MKNFQEVHGNNSRIFHLDFIRSVAAIIIVLYHFNIFLKKHHVAEGAAFFQNTDDPIYSLYAMAGNFLFIILSGASLMQSTKSGLDIKSFYLKRFLRIYPLYWFFLLVALFISPYEVSTPFLYVLNILGVNNGLIGTWYIAFIVNIYLMFPLLRALFLKNKPLVLAVAFVFTLGIYRLFNFLDDVFVFPFFHLFTFLAGMAFVFYFKEENRLSNLLASIFFGVAYIVFSGLGLPIFIKMIFFGIFLFSCLSSLSFMFKGRIMVKLISWLSRYSYGVILFQFIFISRLLELFEGSRLSVVQGHLLFLTILILLFLFSYLATNFVELMLKKLSLVTRSRDRFHLP